MQDQLTERIKLEQDLHLKTNEFFLAALKKTPLKIISLYVAYLKNINVILFSKLDIQGQ